MAGAVLVTGASGFIGRRLVPKLAASGFTVRAATRAPETAPSVAGVTAVQVPDFTAAVDWPALVDGVDSVVHLAGLAHMERGFGDAALYHRINAAPAAALAKAAARAGVRRFVLLSSLGAQSGPSASHTVTERDEPKPTEDYGHSKLAAEAAVRETGVPHTILRPVIVYGRGVKGTMERLVRIAASPYPLPLAALDSRRSLLGVDNLIAAIEFALRADRSDTYLVADPEALSVAEIVATLRAAMGRSPGLFPFPPALLKAALTLTGRGKEWSRIGEPLVIDPGKLIAAGWRPPADTRTGLRQMVTG